MSARATEGGRGRGGRTHGVRRPLPAIVLAAVAAAGCENPFSPEGTDPGVYKGASDPLFEQPAEERDAALRERFELIQNR